MINNNSIYRKTGGGFIGSLRFTYPLIELIVEENLIRLKPIIGNSWKFSPEDVVSIEPYSDLWYKGIQIKHIKKRNPDLIVFRTTSIKEVIEEIEKIGFIPKAKPLD
ncbi:hypothetical protein [Faecalibacter bovis]|uniref:Uncharacterized protein n=1 Tax=Faecalibacter bovis TaxID=2898187 RepID=A0ABX7XFZ4_9FLAO|nr:hypothetical protein [Faecalibacter bovis]MBS7333085.1 hypothetical protein [Weeksellaceae bacterium]QTV06865.1 hypothetical protein J9309_06015 [Faecalibacter bovis]